MNANGIPCASVNGTFNLGGMYFQQNGATTNNFVMHKNAMLLLLFGSLSMRFNAFNFNHIRCDFQFIMESTCTFLIKAYAYHNHILYGTMRTTSSANGLPLTSNFSDCVYKDSFYNQSIKQSIKLDRH